MSTFCLVRISFAQKPNISEYAAAAPGMELIKYSSQGTVWKMPNILM